MRLISLFLIVVIVLLIMMFMVKNSKQMVEELWIFQYTYSDVSLVFVLFGSFAFGVVMGYLIPVFQYLGAKNEVRKLKRESKKIRSELDDLRNVGIESGLEVGSESPDSAEESDSSRSETDDKSEDENSEQ